MYAKFTSKLSTKTHLTLPLPLPLTLPLTTLALPPLIISLTKIAFNSGDTSLNGIVMGFPPFPAPVSLETAIPCPPVALFGAHCAMLLEAAVSLGGFTFRAPTSILPILPGGFSFILAFVVRQGLALSAMNQAT